MSTRLASYKSTFHRQIFFLPVAHIFLLTFVSDVQQSQWWHKCSDLFRELLYKVLAHSFFVAKSMCHWVSRAIISRIAWASAAVSPSCHVAKADRSHSRDKSSVLIFDQDGSTGVFRNPTKSGRWRLSSTGCSWQQVSSKLTHLVFDMLAQIREASLLAN